MGIISYAQNFEDVLLHRVFGGQETGFYVDVGAFHPVIGSVTKNFYDRGWNGINVEPGSVFSDLAAARPGDINLCMAVFDRAGEIAFIEDEADRGMSRVVTEDGSDTVTRMVVCNTLQAIVDAHANGRPVDFIKIDAEGAETAIVHSTDWRRLRPRVLLLEATLPWSSKLSNQEWESTLLQQGYVRAYFDGINCFYIPDEEVPALLGHFQVPVNVLDRAERHVYEVTRTQLHLRNEEVAGLVAERDTLRARLDTANLELQQLTSDQTERQAALNEAHVEIDRLTVFREGELSRLAMSHEAELRQIAESFEAKLAQSKVSYDNSIIENAKLVAERDALHTAIHGHQIDVIRLSLERDTVRAALDAQLQEKVASDGALVAEPAIPQLVVSTRPRKRLARYAAKMAYRLVRPIVRPVVWRLRGFMTVDLLGRIGHLEQRLALVGATPPQTTPIVVMPEIPPPSIISIRDDGAAAEMRKLAVEMERTLLTLALERA